MLMDNSGDTICFAYPKDCQKLQIFYSTDIKCTDVAEKLRSTDPIKVCAERVRYYTYPATEYDTIFTTMINYQDVLKQKERENGPLWSDEGVYHIAKEMQLLYPQKFSNIFLEVGGFHLEKVVIGCLGTYLESSGIENL